MSRGRSAMLALSAAFIALSPLVGDRACAGEACSCGYRGGRFLVEYGAAIPRDSIGIPWSGMVEHDDDHQPRAPAPSGFAIERVTPNGRAHVGVELELLRGPLVQGGRFGAYIVLVKPRGGFVAGNQYVFTDYGGHTGSHWGYDEPKKVVVNVSERGLADLPAASMPTTIEADPTIREPLRVITHGGSCSVEMDAARIDLRLAIGDAALEWADLVLYTTTVNGEIWRPRRSLCQDVAAGESWAGPGAERVFADCNAGERRYGRPSVNAGEGVHEVTMTAWWPGVDWTASATTRVELSCGTEPPPAWPW